MPPHRDSFLNYLIPIFAGYWKGLAVGKGQCIGIGFTDVRTAHQEGAVNAHEFYAQQVLPLGNGSLVAVFLAVGGMNPDLRIIALHIEYIRIKQAYRFAVTGESDAWRSLFEMFAQVLREQIITSRKKHQQ